MRILQWSRANRSNQHHVGNGGVGISGGLAIGFALALANCAAPQAAQAQVVSAPLPDMGAYAKASDLAAVQAAMPVAASMVAPNEGVDPTIGTPGTYRPADAVAPRISRSAALVVTGNLGMVSVTWSPPLPSGMASYPVFFTPIGAVGGQPVKCKVVTSTATSLSAQCLQESVTTLTLSALTVAGAMGLALPLNAPAPAGVQVFALAIPATQ